VQFVFFNFVDMDRLKCAEANVQCDFCGLDASFSELGENLRCEMQASGGGGD